MKYTIPIALTFLLGSCTEGTQANGSEAEGELELPTADEVDAIDAEADAAAAQITEENADDALESLEAELGDQ